MDNFRLATEIATKFRCLLFNSPENPNLEVLNKFGVFLGAVSPKTEFVPHIIIIKLVGFSISDILVKYNTAADNEGCRNLYVIKEQNIFHGFITTTAQDTVRMLQKQKQNKCVLQLLCAHSLLFLASYRANTGDENKLTDKEFGLLCDAINETHGAGSAFIYYCS